MFMRSEIGILEQNTRSLIIRIQDLIGFFGVACCCNVFIRILHKIPQENLI